MCRLSGFTVALVVLCLSVLSVNSAAANTVSNTVSNGVSGFWLTENKRSVIEIAPCRQGLCGYIYWIIPGGMQYDSKNPDAGEHKTPMCGLGILWGFKQETPLSWTSGKIYKADDGDTYDARVQLEPDGTLQVRGYMGISLFGKSQTWTRVNPADYPACTPPKS